MSNYTREDITRLAQIQKRTDERKAKAVENEQGFFGDVVDAVQHGVLSGAADLADGVGYLTGSDTASDSASFLRKHADNQIDQMSTDGREAFQNVGFESDEESSLGLGLKDGSSLKGFGLNILSGVGSFAPTMIPGLGAAKAISVAGKATGLAGKGTKAATVLDKGADVVGFAGAGAVSIGGSTANQAYETVANADFNTLKESEIFQKQYWDLRDKKELDHVTALKEAREGIARELATEAAKDGAVMGAITQGALGPVFGKLFRGEAGGIGKAAATGAATEGAQEFVESGGQTAISNKNVNPAVPTNTMDNVIGDALTGVAVGGPVGSAFGVGGAAVSRFTKTKDSVDDPLNLSEQDQGYQVVERQLAEIEGLMVENGDNLTESEFAELEAKRNELLQRRAELTGEQPMDFAGPVESQTQSEQLALPNQNIIYGERPVPSQEQITARENNRAAFEDQFGEPRNTSKEGEYLGQVLPENTPKEQGSTFDGEFSREPLQIEAQQAVEVASIENAGIIYGDKPENNTRPARSDGLTDPYTAPQPSRKNDNPIYQEIKRKQLLLEEHEQEAKRLRDDLKTRQQTKKQQVQQTQLDGLENKAEVKAAKGKAVKAYTPSNKPVDLEYQIVNADDLVTSNNDDLTPNANYPQTLQNRDRTTDSSRNQINSMANQLIPEKLSESADVSTGSPIVRNGIVESGNGRSLAIRKAYNEGKAANYKSYLEQNADRFGINPDELSQFEKPILVRQRQTEMTPEELAAYTKDANTSEGQSLKPSEQAKSDAQRIQSEDLDLVNLPESGDVAAPSNKAFISKFLGRLSDNERAGLVGKDGSLTQQGATRVQNAIFAKAYQSNDLIDEATDATTSDVKGVTNALVIAAPNYAKLNGEVPELTKTIVDAVALIKKSRRDNIALQELTSQFDIEKGEPVDSTTADLATFLNDNIRSAKRMGDGLSSLAIQAKSALRNSQSEGLFGTAPAPTAKGLINANEQIRQQRPVQKTEPDSTTPNARESNGRSEQQREASGRAALGSSGGVEERRQGKQSGLKTKLEKNEANSRYDVREPSQVQISGKRRSAGIATQTTLDLFIPTTVPSRIAAKQAEDNFRIRFKQVKVGEVKSGYSRVKSAEEAAHVIASFRKHAQETMLALVTNEQGEIVNLIRHTKGLKSSSSVGPTELIGAIIATEGAKKVWFGHNHPSGIPAPSSADFNITNKLASLMDGAGVKIEGHLIVAPGGKAVVFQPNSSEHIDIKISPKPRKNSIGVTERVIRKRNTEELTVSSPWDALKAVEDMKAGEGLLLLDTQHHIVGSIAFSPLEMSKLKSNGNVKRIFKALDATNASAVIVKTKQGETDAVRNLVTFLKLADIRVLDHFYNSDGMLISGAQDGSLSLEPSRDNTYLSVKEGNRQKSKADDIRKVVEPFIKQLHEESTFQVVQSVNDLPFAVRLQVKKQLSKSKGENATVRGVNAGDKNYLIADGITDEKEAVSIFLHEVVGHKAVLNMLGKEGDSIMERIAYSYGPKQLQDLIKAYGADFKTKEGRILLGKEKVAQMAENNEKPSLLGKLVANVKSWLRKFFPNIKWSDNDVLNMLTTARDKVENRYMVKIDLDQDTESDKSESTKKANLSIKNDLPDDIGKIISDTQAKPKSQETLLDKVKDYAKKITNVDSTVLKQEFVDSYAAIEALEKDINLGKLMDGKESAYKAALRTANLDSVMEVMMRKGALEIKDGGFQIKEGTKGFLEIFESIADADQMQLWETWAGARRAKRIIEEDTKANSEGFGQIKKYRAEIAKLKAIEPAKHSGGLTQWQKDMRIAQKGLEEAKSKATQKRERNYNPAQIKKVLDYVSNDENLKSSFETAQKEWAAFNKAVLDMTEQAGLINPEARKLWENDDYVPFHRVSEAQEDEGFSFIKRKKGLSGQKSGIEKLSGGVEKLNILESMVRNTAHMVDASFKNIAMQRIADLAEGAAMEKMPSTKMDLAETKAMLETMGYNPEGMDGDTLKVWSNQLERYQSAGKGTVSVSRGGKVERYQITDPVLFRAVTQLGPMQVDGLLRVLGVPKRVLTTLVTSDPGFMGANFIRDTLSTWVTVDAKTKPFYDSLKGAAKSLKKSDSQWAIMAAGAGGGGYYDTAPDNVRQHLSTLEKGGALHKPKQLWDAWMRVGQAGENANRIAVFDAILKDGGSVAEAAHQAQDVINFSKRGANKWVQAAITLIPFLNARIQGLERLYRGAKDNPKAFFLKGSIIMGAGLALLAANWDNEEYWDLDEWDRDANWHIFVDGKHFRIPKPFEVGAVFGTIPERAFEQMRDDADMKLLGGRMLAMLTNTFAVNPLGIQAVKPALDVAMNENGFTGNPILSMGDEYRTPEGQYSPWTSETMKQLAKSMPDSAPDWMRSPKRLEYLFKGYFGTLGGYALALSDVGTESIVGVPTKPTMNVSQLPVLKRFYKDGVASSKHIGRFYDMLNEVSSLQSEIRSKVKEQQVEEAKKLQMSNLKKLQTRSTLNRTAKSLSTINARIKATYTNKSMTAKQKRELIDKLSLQRNEIARNASLKYYELFR